MQLLVQLKCAHQDRIDEVVADNFVTYHGLAHPMSYLTKVSLMRFKDGELSKNRNLCDLLHTRDVGAQTPVQKNLQSVDL